MSIFFPDRHLWASFREVRVEGVQVPAGENVDVGTISIRYRPLVIPGSVVTATRTDRPIEDVSNPVNVVEAADLRERESKSSAGALREETGLFVQKTGHGGGSAIIRGFGSSQILLLVDGIRLNNSTFRLGNHPYLTMVDNQLVRRLEVIRGPTSVMHGSDALGGTVNLITRGALDGDLDPGFGYRIFGRAATADGERTGRGEISLRGERIGVRAGVTVKRFDEVRTGGLTLQLENPIDSHRLTGGFDIYIDDIRSRRSTRVFGLLPVAPGRSGVSTIAYTSSRTSARRFAHRTCAISASSANRRGRYTRYRTPTWIRNGW